MDQLISEVGKIKDMTGMFTIWDVALSLVLSFVLSFFVAKIYQVTHRGVSYSQSFVETLVLMGTVVSLIMLIIGSNIARAFALVGALSVVRFRNAVKDSKDVGYVFFVMAIGMACGTRFYMLAVFAAVTISAIMLILYRFQPFARNLTERILMIQVPDGYPHEQQFETSFQKYFLESHLIGIETVVHGKLIELVYSVSLRKQFKPSDFLGEIRRLVPDNRVTLIEGQQQIDL